MIWAEPQSKHFGLEPHLHFVPQVRRRRLIEEPRPTNTNLVFQPVFSSLSDLFGRKPLVLVALAWFTIGAIVAGVANNFTHMLIGRSLQGIGGGGIITLTGILIADIVPLSERAKYFGMLSAIWSLGTVVGPVIGGCFAEKATWVRTFLFLLWLFNNNISLALDLLYQFPVHRNRGDLGRLVVQLPSPEGLLCCAATKD